MLDPNRLQLGGYFSNPEVVEFHRAIGTFTASFSEMIAEMRHGVVTFLVPDDGRNQETGRLFDVLFATMTAKPIVDSFFALAKAVGRLNEKDDAIVRAIRKTVSEQIAFRNDIAHADWNMGWETVDTAEPMVPSGRRIKTIAGIPQDQELGITLEKFSERIVVQDELTRSIRGVARLCGMRKQGEGVLLRDRFQLSRWPGTGITIYRWVVQSNPAGVVPDHAESSD